MEDNPSKKIKKFLSPVEIVKDEKDAVKNFLMSLKTTSVCRFNAAERIRTLSKGAFVTTTIFSLGLILIPLLQMIVRKEVYEAQTLSVIQIFLAVSVLVYSTIIGTAKYEVRASDLDRCGVDLKNMIREIRSELKDEKDIDLKKYSDQYHEIIKNCENHNRSDFKKAQLYLTEYWETHFICRKLFRLEIFIKNSLPYVPQFLLVILELIFLLDLLSITQILTKYLKVA